MDAIAGLWFGLGVALEPSNLLYVLIGVTVGMFIGVLPGLGPAPAIALLLPVTYVLPTEGAIIMLAGIYYGAYYGGTITSVLLKLPGEAASVITALEGHEMARRGRAGPALGIAAIGSFLGGISAVIVLVLVGSTVAGAAISFGPPEYAALALIGLSLVMALGRHGFVRSAVPAVLGLLIATVGIDPVTGGQRFTFGSPEVMGGINFLAVVMGLFGIGEILHNLSSRKSMTARAGSVGRVIPRRQDLRQSVGPFTRGAVLGFPLGVIPGGGGVIASVASYGVEERLGRKRGMFGRGDIAGVAGPETANNAASTASFLPLLTFGFPSNALLALILGALLIHGVQPGPQLVSEHPNIFWGVIASMIIGNLVLLVLSLPLVGIFVRVLRVRIGIVSSLIIAITMVGIFSVNSSIFDMWTALAFGLLGYVLRKFNFEIATLVIAMILGPVLESSFRQSMAMSGGEFEIFVSRPVPLIVLSIIACALLVKLWRRGPSLIRSRSAWRYKDGGDGEDDGRQADGVGESDYQRSRS